MGSPSGVAVPCIPSAASWEGAMLASARAARSTSDWAGPLGAVSALERPSCVNVECVCVRVCVYV